MFLPFIGLEVAFVSMFYEYVFANLHFNYAEHIPLWTYAAQLFFSHSAYGYDRLVDVKTNSTDNQELIDYVNSHTRQIGTTIASSVIMGIVCLAQNECTSTLIIPFLLSVFFYREFKVANPLLKPFFISTLIVVSSVVFPSMIVENNLNIFNDLNALLPPFANLYSSSNYLDIVDLEIDKSNNITTLPVLYGNRTAIAASFLANIVSLVSHIHHPHFQVNPSNVLFQAQNLFSGVSLFNKKPVDFRKSDRNPPKMSLTPKTPLFYPIMTPFLPRLTPMLRV